MDEPEVAMIEAQSGPAATGSSAAQAAAMAIMGRRGSFHPLETSTITMDLSKTFGSPKLTQNHFDNFDFVKSVTKADSAMISEIASEDNPMKYKRKVRRVSLITSEGGGAFQIDLSAKRERSPSPAIVPPVIHEVTSALELQQPPTHPVIARLTVNDSESEDAIKSPECLDVEDYNRTPRARAGSIREIVEEQHIMALALKVAQDEEQEGVDKVTPKGFERSTEDEDGKASGKAKKKSSILDSWFFRNQDYSDDEQGEQEDDVQPLMHQMDGIGGGQLTSRVVSALGIQVPTRKESRNMNLWIPQGM